MRNIFVQIFIVFIVSSSWAYNIEYSFVNGSISKSEIHPHITFYHKAKTIEELPFLIPEDSTSMQEIIKKAKELGEDSIYINLIIKFNSYLLSINKYQEVYQRSIDALKIASTNRDLVNVGYIYSQLGLACKELDMVAEAISYYSKAVNFFLNLNQEKLIDLSIGTPSTDYEVIESPEKSIQILLDAVRSSQKINTTFKRHLQLSIYYSWLGNLYFKMEKRKKRSSIFKKPCKLGGITLSNCMP